MRACIHICLLLFSAVAPAVGQQVTWNRTGDTDLLFSSENHALFAHPDGDIFVGTIDWLGPGDYSGSEGAVYRSLDGGETWDRMEYEGDGITSFTVWPGGDVVLASLGSVRRSTDRGSTWEKIMSPETWRWFHSVHVTADSVIYVGLGGVPGVVAGGLIRSTDAGETWEEQDLGTDSAFPASIREILALGDGTLFAASDLGVYRLESGGVWTHSGPDSSGYRNLAATADGLVFAGSTDALYRSSDSGRSWRLLTLPVSDIFDIAVNDRGDIFVSSGDGLYGSRTHGDAWERLGDAHGYIAVAADNHLVSASRLDGGLYRSSSVVLVRNQQRVEIMPDWLELHQNYPNPFARKTAIEFTLARPALVVMEVFDVTGRLVAKRVNKETSAGRHTVQFDRGSLSAGVYPYRLTVGATVKTRFLTIR